MQGHGLSLFAAAVPLAAFVSFITNMSTHQHKARPGASISLTALAQGASLRPGESVWAALETDLDERLRFGKGAVLLTNERILAFQGDEKKWQSRDLLPGLALQHTDHAGVGTLQLRDAKYHS